MGRMSVHWVTAAIFLGVVCSVLTAKGKRSAAMTSTRAPTLQFYCTMPLTLKELSSTFPMSSFQIALAPCNQNLLLCIIVGEGFCGFFGFFCLTDSKWNYSMEGDQSVIELLLIVCTVLEWQYHREQCLSLQLLLNSNFHHPWCAQKKLDFLYFL